MSRRGSILQTALEDDPIVEAAPADEAAAAPGVPAAAPAAANDAAAAPEPVLAAEAVTESSAPAAEAGEPPAAAAGDAPSAPVRRGGSFLQTAMADDPTEADAEERADDAEDRATTGAAAPAADGGTDAPAAGAPGEAEPALNLATVGADPLGLPPKVTAGGGATGGPATGPAASAGPLRPPVGAAAGAGQAPVDDVHAELMALLARPMQALLGASDARVADLGNQRQSLAAERAALEASLADKNKAEMQAAAAAASRRGNGSFGGGLGQAMAAIGQGIGSRLGRQNAVDTLDGVEARRLRDLVGRMGEIDSELSSNRDFRGGLLAKNYARTLEAADTFRRAQVKLSRAVEDFNAKFEASAKGKAFLRSLEGMAVSKGMSVDDLRANLHDLSNGDPAVERLRASAEALCREPEFAEDVARMESLVGTVRRNGQAFARGLKTAEQNGLDLGQAEGLDEVVSKMKLPDSKLARPGAEVPLDALSEEQKKWNESMMELIRALLDRLKAAVGLGPKAS